MENLIKLHNSTFLVQPARNAFGQIGDSTSMSISVPQLLFHPSASAWQAGIRYSITSVIFLNSTALPLTRISGKMRVLTKPSCLSGLFVATILVETLEMWSTFSGGALYQKRGTALGARLGYRFVPYSKGAARITGATIKQLTSL